MPFIPLDAAPTKRRTGFIPIGEDDQAIAPTSGFVPPEQEPGRPSVLRNLALNNPLTAIGETGLNLATQGVALPVAGLAGIGTAAANAMGLTKKTGADAVHAVSEKLTYQPRGELGKAATSAVMYPFEKLAEAGDWAGTKTLDATGSPAAATVVGTAINAAPMVLGVKGRKAKAQPKVEPVEPIEVAPPRAPEPILDPASGPMSRGVLASRKATTPEPAAPMPAHPEAEQNAPRLATDASAIEGAGRGFVPLADGDMAGRAATSLLNNEPLPIRVEKGFANEEANRDYPPLSERVQGMAAHEEALPEPEGRGLSPVRGPGRDGVPGVVERLPKVPERPGAEAVAGVDLGPDRPELQLRTGEVPLGDAPAAGGEPKVLPPRADQRRNIDDPGGGPRTGHSPDDVPAAPLDPEARRGSRSDNAQASLSQGLEVPDPRRQDIERAGMGEAARDPRADFARESSARHATGSGTEQRPIQTAQRELIASSELAREIDAAAHEAATSPLNDKPMPTEAQIDSGTYSKGHIKLHGLDIAIENPRGSVRSGTDKNGKPWQTTLQDHYGYIKRTEGADGDHVDAFIGPRPDSERVFVVDQVDPKTMRFDEHKAMIGYPDEAAAHEGYLANYEPGWQGMGAIHPMTMSEFKSWLKDGDTTKPVPTADLPAESMAMADIRESRQAMAPGANYAGFIADAPGKADGISLADKPIRREDVLRPLVKSMDVPLYQGRVKGKALGTYTTRKEVVRLKRSSDIETASHEIAHLIDDRVPELKAQYRVDQTLAAELRGVSYDKTKPHEGFAEFVRLWATQPERAKAAAPHAFEWFESFVKTHEYGPALRRAQADMTAWFGQEALHRAQSKIGAAKEINAVLDGNWDRFRQSVTDDLHGIMKMERDLTGKLSPVGPYETSRLTRAASSITEGAVRYGRPVKKADGSFDFEGHGLEKILEPVAGRLDDWLLYAVGRSAKELMSQGREHLFTPAEIDAMLRLKQDGFEKQFQLYQAWNKGIVDFAQDMGVINPETRRLWQRSAYLPFHRVGQAGEARSMKPGEWSGVKALTGGTENIRDVLGNIVGNATMLMEKAIQNEARMKVADLADKAQGGGRFMVKIPTESRQVRIDAQQVAGEVLRKLGADPHGPLTPELAALEREILKNPGFFEFMLNNQAPSGGNVVAVMRNGKKEFYEVADPVLYRALSALDRPDPGWLTRWLGVPKRIGQVTITLTPDFMVANIARDTIMGAVMSRAGFRPVVDSLKGMRYRIMNDPIYKEFIANGGGLSSYLLDESRMRHHLERFYTQKGIDYRTVLDTPDKLLYAIETIADSFEVSTRLGEYKRAIERGENPRHAAYLAREVSTDFAMRGDSKALGFLYDTVMFLRPAVVSMDRLFRGVAHDQNRGVIAIKTGTLALSSMALYLLNRDNPDYQDLPDWDRDNHWHFFVPTPDGETVHLRYPKIWEIGAIASAAERTVEKVIQSDPKGLGKDFARIIGQTFGLNWMPQIIAPLAEQATNRNSFTKAPIETPAMENVQPFLRAKPGTSETLKAAGMATRDLPESLQVNPARTEALLRGYFNTWALYGLTIADEVFHGDKLPERRADQLPVVRRFYEQKPAIHIRHETMFYDILGEAKRLDGTLRALDKMGRPDIADEKEQDPLAPRAKQMERAAKHVHAIDEEMKAVKQLNITRQEKRLRLDALTTEKNVLMKATVEEVKP